MVVFLFKFRSFLLAQRGPKSGPRWATVRNQMAQGWPTKTTMLQGIVIEREKLAQRGPLESWPTQDFVTQKVAHQTPLKGVIYMAKRMVSAPIFTRCDPCNPLYPNPSWMLHFATAISRQRCQYAVAQHGSSAGRIGGSRLELAVSLACLMTLATGGLANTGWTEMGSTWSEDTTPEIGAVAPRVSSKSWGAASSFDERSRPSSKRPDLTTWVRPKRGSKLDGLREVISLAESKKHRYNSIHFSAKKLPNKKPVDLTIGEIFNWIEDTPGQHHAIGFYQIIPKTLRRLVKKAGLSKNEVFNKETQDLLGDVLIAEAGYSDFLKGRKSPSAFMDALAKIWAGLPMKNGRSAYHGYAGNRATIKRSFFEAQVGRIFDLPRKRS